MRVGVVVVAALAIAGCTVTASRNEDSDNEATARLVQKVASSQLLATIHAALLAEPRAAGIVALNAPRLGYRFMFDDRSAEIDVRPVKGRDESNLEASGYAVEYRFHGTYLSADPQRVIREHVQPFGSLALKIDQAIRPSATALSHIEYVDL